MLHKLINDACQLGVLSPLVTVEIDVITALYANIDDVIRDSRENAIVLFHLHSIFMFNV